jgi:NAD(P)H-hydrate epimerase
METVTAEQMREVDRIMVEEFGVRIIQMMEAAGAGIAETSKEILGTLDKKKILILSGKGNNGGDGIVAARYLNNWGAKPKVILADTPGSELISDQVKIIENFGIDCFRYNELDLSKEISNSDLVVDSLIGYSLRGDPNEPIAGIIRKCNDHARKVLAVDIPSGMDPDSGHPKKDCIRADSTATLALPKTGILKPGANKLAGEIFLVDIGVPPEVYSRFGIDPRKIQSLFSGNRVRKLR